MNRGFVLVALLLLSAGITMADSPVGGTEITIHSGWSFLDAEYRYSLCPECLAPIFPTLTTSVHDSAMFGFKGGYNLNRFMEVEGAFAISPGHRLERAGYPVCIPGLPCPAIDLPVFILDTRAVAYQYDGNFVYNILAGSAVPFVTFGIGGVSTATDSETHTDFAVNFGGGAKVYFGNVGVRMEVNDHVITDYFLNGKTEHDLQVQYGFVFRLH